MTHSTHIVIKLTAAAAKAMPSSPEGLTFIVDHFYAIDPFGAVAVEIRDYRPENAGIRWQLYPGEYEIVQ